MMFASLLKRECRQTMKSPIYWLFVAALVLFILSQMGDAKSELAKPVKGEDYYGQKVATDTDTIMGVKLYELLGEYADNSYAAYPVGFYKEVRLGEADEVKMGRIVETLTGVSAKKEAEALLETVSMEKYSKQAYPKGDLTFSVFKEKMDEAADLIGIGSSYGAGSLKSVTVNQDYEGALADYHTMMHEDKVSRGLARLYCDYCGIILSILPMFLIVTGQLRDKRARMTELVYARQASAEVIVTARFLATVILCVLPVLLLSVYPLVQCIGYGRLAGASVDYLAFVRYILGILLPEIMVVTALGMMITQLTDTALAVLVQGVWAFASLFAGISKLHGGDYGWNLIVRHNTVYNRAGFLADLAQLMWNRGLYVLLALLFAALTIRIFNQKRKGVLDIHGTLFGNRKRKLQA